MTSRIRVISSASLCHLHLQTGSFMRPIEAKGILHVPTLSNPAPP